MVSQSLKLEQIEALELHLTCHDVLVMFLVILSTGFGESLIYQVFCLAKLPLNQNVNVLLGDFAAQHHIQRTIKLRNYPAVRLK